MTTQNSRFWRRLGIILAVPLVLSYYWYSQRMVPRGGTTVGLAYGVLGLLLISFLLFHSVRKRWHRCVYGKTEIWLNAHIYLGLLAMLLIYMHAGFRFQDLSATVAAGLLSVVVVSGVVGTILYTVLPQHLRQVKGNLMPQEVSDKMNELAELIQKATQRKSPSFHSACQLFLEEATRRRVRKEKVPVLRRLIEQIRVIPAEEQEAMKQVVLLAKQFTEMHAQFRTRMRLKNLLESWLYLHVPFSVAMVLAIILHLFAVAYY